MNEAGFKRTGAAKTAQKCGARGEAYVVPTGEAQMTRKSGRTTDLAHESSASWAAILCQLIAVIGAKRRRDIHGACSGGLFGTCDG